MKTVMNKRKSCLCLSLFIHIGLFLAAGLIFSGCSSPEEDQETLLKTALEASGDKAMKAAHKLTDQDYLGQVACEANDKWVRFAALRRLTDPQLLEKAAQKALMEEDLFLRSEGVKHVTDQELLLKVLIEDNSITIQLAALERLTDQEILARISFGLDSSIDSISLRKKAIERLEDQSLLARIALEDPSRQLRETAVQSITDPELASEIRAWFYPEDTRKIEDQSLLERIALEAKEISVRIEAVNLVENRAVLMEVAAEGGYPAHVSEAARKRLTEAELEILRPFADPLETHKVTDQALLARIVREAKNSQVRHAAATRLLDRNLLAWVAMNDEVPTVRTVAVRQMIEMKNPVRNPSHVYSYPPIDQRLLARIAREDEDISVRGAAIKGLTDQAMLAHIAMTDEYVNNRRDALRRLTDPVLRNRVENWLIPEKTEAVSDPQLLERIALESISDSVREVAAGKIDDQNLLARIALTDSSWKVQNVAIRRVFDQGMIENIALEKPDWQSDTSRCALLHATFMLNHRRLLEEIARDAPERKAKYARLKLALMDWADPSMRFTINIGRPEQLYNVTTISKGIMNYKITVPTLKFGEEVEVEVFKDGEKIASWRGKTNFPGQYNEAIEDFPLAIDPAAVIRSLSQNMNYGDRKNPSSGRKSRPDSGNRLLVRP